MTNLSQWDFSLIIIMYNLSYILLYMWKAGKESHMEWTGQPQILLKTTFSKLGREENVCVNGAQRGRWSRNWVPGDIYAGSQM